MRRPSTSATPLALVLAQISSIPGLDIARNGYEGLAPDDYYHRADVEWSALLALAHARRAATEAANVPFQNPQSSVSKLGM